MGVIVRKSTSSDSVQLARMRASLWVLILCASVGISDSTAQSTVPSIPLPSGLVEASGLFPKLQAAVVASLPPYKTPLGMYYTVDSVTEMLDHGYSAPAITGKATLVRQKSRSAAVQDFQLLKAGFKKDGARRFDPSDPIIKQILGRYEAAANEAANDGQPHIAVTGASQLGFVLDDENEFIVSTIASYLWSDGQSSAPMVFAESVGVVLLDGGRVELMMMVPFQGAASIASANSIMVEWMRDVRRANDAK